MRRIRDASERGADFSEGHSLSGGMDGIEGGTHVKRTHFVF